VEPLLRGSGRFTFQADVTQEKIARLAKSQGRDGVPGNIETIRNAPIAMTIAT
jgi:hypothetical protein